MLGGVTFSIEVGGQLYVKSVPSIDTLESAFSVVEMNQDIQDAINVKYGSPSQRAEVQAAIVASDDYLKEFDFDAVQNLLNDASNDADWTTASPKVLDAISQALSVLRKVSTISVGDADLT